ncbi:MAG: 2-oxo acid dehydrogenase subunit E2 [Lachnospiraceae bacterium]|nr:2-oxo acid dehydrogenase subunit E2 [Lachnospiraceae bacterium]
MGRRDAVLVKSDAMHFIMGTVYPNRADNEAFIRVRVDMEPIKKYLEEKTASDPDFKYTLFQVIVASFLKCAVLRPKLNCFYANKNYYRRKDITAGFVVKKEFSDEGGEGFAFLKAEEDWTMDVVHEEFRKKVRKERSSKASNSTEDAMEIFNKMPRFLSKTVIAFVRMLDRHGHLPKSFTHDDPNYATIFFSNLGSIGMDAGYHHLSNWGTTSLFCTVGIIHKEPVYDENGNAEVREVVDLGLTIDERIADGYYYSKTVRLLKKLLSNPWLLDQTFKTEVEDY